MPTTTAALRRIAPAERWLARTLEPLLGMDRISEAAGNGASLWRAVLDQGLLGESELVEAVCVRWHLARADLSSVSARALELVPERWARQFNVLPLAAGDHVLDVATGNPCDLECERTLAFAAGRAVRFAVAPPDAIAARLDDVYRSEADRDAGAAAVAREPERMVDVQLLAPGGDLTADAMPDSEDAEAVTRLVDELLGEGIASRASDIHIEPEEQGIAVRHRIDGVMRLVRRLPRAAAAALVSRIKIVSSLDISDRLRPQDGRARVAVNGVAVDLRISTLPASHGEKVVIRVLDSRASVMTLDAMGFAASEQERIERLLQAREGLILVTGPTGSGKTTTLYAALRALKQRGVNIVTVEDPIEYRLPGIVQVQVRERAGLTFAAALRSIMRQDPDVLLIGEIRDRETAEIAIQASLTGHLVLSTLHTNDAASAVTRLIDIGVAPYKIATAVKGVIAQRLVRRLCAKCRRRAGAHSIPPIALAVGEAAHGHASHADLDERFERVGCPACGGTGYLGRVAIVEVLLGSAEFERCVAAGQPAERIAEAARREGMSSLWTSGVARVRAGDTTAAELRRVATPDAAPGESPIGPRDAGLSARMVMDSGAAIRYLPPPPTALSSPSNSTEPRVAEVRIASVDVYVVHAGSDGWRVLVLQRAPDTRCPASWEAVHGHIEPGEEPEDAAAREVREETGLEITKLYSITVQPFYVLRSHVVHLAVVFAAFVADMSALTLGPEHQRGEWLPVPDALERFHWPREREALREIVHLLHTGDAGPVEDVLRVEL